MKRLESTRRERIRKALDNNAVKLLQTPLGAFLIMLCSVYVCNDTLISEPPGKPESLVYPGWFWDMPTDDNAIYSVGYSHRFLRIDTSFSYAYLSGVWELVKASNCNINLNHHLFDRFGKQRLIGFRESETIDSTLYYHIEKTCHVIDSAIVGDMVISLCSSASYGISNRLMTKSFQYGKPPWLETLPSSNCYIYEVGTAQLYFYEQHSWEEAEAHSRRQLAQAIESIIYSENIRLDNSKWRWSRSKSCINLKNCSIVSRWLDIENSQCYVLSRVPILP